MNHLEALKAAAAAVPEDFSPPQAWDQDRNYHDDELAYIAFCEKATPAQLLSLLAEREHLLTENEVLKDAGRITLSGVSFSKLELIERAVSSVKGPSKYRSKHGIARWVLVKGAFGVGSGVANAMCRLFGFDPDENLRS